jgi:hypothetical protein
MASRVVDRDFDAKKADYKGLKNSWKWEWLEKKVGDELISEFIRKINSKGLAFCERCQDINYATLEAFFHYRSSCPILNFEYKVSKSESPF